MCKPARPIWMDRRRMVGAVLRSCLVIYFILQIVGTPIHLYLEPHSDLTDAHGSQTSGQETSAIGCESHASHSGHGRHSASQHDLQALRSQRVPVAEMVMVAVVECLPTEKSCRDEQVLVFSGLSPPELPRSWQFLFRAALPVRAPSLAS